MKALKNLTLFVSFFVSTTSFADTLLVEFQPCSGNGAFLCAILHSNETTNTKNFEIEVAVIPDPALSVVEVQGLNDKLKKIMPNNKKSPLVKIEGQIKDPSGFITNRSYTLVVSDILQSVQADR